MHIRSQTNHTSRHNNSNVIKARLKLQGEKGNQRRKLKVASMKKSPFIREELRADNICPCLKSILSSQMRAERDLREAPETQITLHRVELTDNQHGIRFCPPVCFFHHRVHLRGKNQKHLIKNSNPTNSISKMTTSSGQMETSRHQIISGVYSQHLSVRV